MSDGVAAEPDEGPDADGAAADGVAATGARRSGLGPWAFAAVCVVVMVVVFGGVFVVLRARSTGPSISVANDTVAPVTLFSCNAPATTVPAGGSVSIDPSSGIAQATCLLCVEQSGSGADTRHAVVDAGNRPAGSSVAVAGLRYDAGPCSLEAFKQPPRN